MRTGAFVMFAVLLAGAAAAADQAKLINPAGQEASDLVKEVNRNGVDSVEAFEGEMEKIKEEKTIQLLIMRARVGFLVVNITP